MIIEKLEALFFNSIGATRAKKSRVFITQPFKNIGHPDGITVPKQCLSYGTVLRIIETTIRASEVRLKRAFARYSLILMLDKSGAATVINSCAC